MKSKQFHTTRRILHLGSRSYLVGILNLTPDSFSDGGEFVDLDAAKARFLRMVEEGAEIIDIGGESTRPGHTPVSVEEEISRVVPFIRSIRAQSEVLISIDTSKAAVAAAALEAGADIVNDVWGAQRDPTMAEVIGQSGAACILMHNRNAEEAGQGDVIEAISTFLSESIRLVKAAGVQDDAIALDPGLGFGKTYEENWEIMRRLPGLVALGYPLLIGASRKSMIAKLLEQKDPKARLYGTLGTTALAIQAGVDFIRVHDIRENRECADVLDHCLRIPIE
ncbi:MAG: dihydropteroate synthase [Opitutales bacterium]